jgi:ferritin-like metal-binding protein YciE
MVQLSERPGVKKITSFQDKFIYEVAAMYDAENRFLEAQQVMWQCCQNNQFRSLIETHIGETEQQIRNLEKVFSTFGQQPQRVTCNAAAGVISDGQKLMLLARDNPTILELGLIGGQSKVEHFEIACYRGLIKGAEQMGQREVVQLLQQNLQQEEQTAQKLEQLLPQLLEEIKSGDGKTTAKSR